MRNIGTRGVVEIVIHYEAQPCCMGYREHALSTNIKIQQVPSVIYSSMGDSKAITRNARKQGNRQTYRNT